MCRLISKSIEQLALDLPKFMAMTDKEKADILLKIIGVGDKLYELENKEMLLYNRRTEIGRIADQKKKYAGELPIYSGVPTEPVSAIELIRQQQDILARNGENQRKRDRVHQIEADANAMSKEISALNQELKRLRETLRSKNVELTKLLADLETARRTTAMLHDESTAELEKNIADIDTLNQKIRANLEREKAEIDAETYQAEYDKLTREIETVKQTKTNLLKNADLPLPELSVKDGSLIYKGFSWNDMSSSEQMKVATAIIRKLNPQCGFVLLDKLEQMDSDTLEEFGKWLEAEGLQAIATRVSTGDECSVIIEDGYIKQDEPTLKTWTPGAF